MADDAFHNAEDFSGGSSDSLIKSGFIAIESVGRRSLGRDLRLKAKDVIVAMGGAPLDCDVDRFDVLLKEYPELPCLLTIYRDGKLFEVYASGPLGCTYIYAGEEEVAEIRTKLPKHQAEPNKKFVQYEALRNIRREVVVYSTAYSPMATMFPPFWLLYHRMWEPLGVVMATYAVSALVQPVLFALIYVLISIYMHRAHIQLLRSYSLFTEHYFWMVFAARSTKEAQQLLRSYDPKCSFQFSYVGKPAGADNKTADSPFTAKEPA